MTRRLFSIFGLSLAKQLSAPVPAAPGQLYSPQISSPTFPTCGYAPDPDVPSCFPAGTPQHLLDALKARESKEWDSFPIKPLRQHQTFVDGTDPFKESNKSRQGLLYRKGPRLRGLLANQGPIRRSLNDYKSDRISIKEELYSLAQSITQ